MARPEHELGPDPSEHHGVDARSVSLDDVQLAAVDLDEATELVVQAIERRAGGLVLTHNLEHLVRIRRSPVFRRAVEQSTLRVADGVPLLWAAALRGTPLPGRVNGTDLMEQLLARLADTPARVYFLGGRGDVAVRASVTARRRYPGLQIAGAHTPAPDLAGNPVALDAEVDRVVAAAPDLLFIGLPSELQAEIGLRVVDRLPSCVNVGVGISFSFLAGDLPRAPVRMQRMGFEWLHRLAQDPRALSGRYARCVPVGVRLLTDSLEYRLRHHA